MTEYLTYKIIYIENNKLNTCDFVVVDLTEFCDILDAVIDGEMERIVKIERVI